MFPLKLVAFPPVAPLGLPRERSAIANGVPPIRELSQLMADLRRTRDAAVTSNETAPIETVTTWDPRD